MSDFNEKLEDLRKKPVDALTEHDRAFLLARSSYLQEHEKIALGIADKSEQAVDESVKPAKKAKAKADVQE